MGLRKAQPPVVPPGGGTEPLEESAFRPSYLLPSLFRGGAGGEVVYLS